MAATSNSGQGHGTQGSPQGTIEEQIYPAQTISNETPGNEVRPPVYAPSPKHEPGHNWGSKNPIKDSLEGQHLLNTGYHDGRQIYNTTNTGELVKFQPDGTPENGYHAYSVSGPPDVPPGILKQMLHDGRISKSTYKKFLKGKKT